MWSVSKQIEMVIYQLTESGQCSVAVHVVEEESYRTQMKTGDDNT